MPSVSKAQRKFFGIVNAIKKGELAKSYSKEAAKVARTLKDVAIKHFAETKESGLPQKTDNSGNNTFSAHGAARKILERRKRTDARARKILGVKKKK